MGDSGRHLIVGTAGHIDHGKTALVRALTGKQTDRLKEEQQRGISIDIDFAPLTFADGTLIGLVDVPGHERFVRNMVAGAAGIDAALLVVDVLEGIKPQTVEHLAILELLGIRRGLVALTKTDLAEPEWTQMAQEVIAEGLQGTVLAQAPIIPVSSQTGAGMAALRAALYDLTQQASDRDQRGAFRLPVDKVYSIPGFGTVVSGTVWRGSVAVGDELEVLPECKPVRIRGIQSHGIPLSAIGPGRRAALNVTGVHHGELQRGVVVAARGSLVNSMLLDVQLRAMTGEQLEIRHRERVRVHLGTAETVGRVLLLEADTLPGGASGYAQLALSSPLVCQHGDHFVIRRLSPVDTIGGGTVLNAAAPKLLRRKREQTLRQLTALDEAGPLQRLLQLIETTGVSDTQTIALDLGLTTDAVTELLVAQVASSRLFALPGGYSTAAQVEAWLAALTESLQLQHQRHRFAAWVARTEVTQVLEPKDAKQRPPRQTLSPRNLAWLLSYGQARGLWHLDGTRMRASGWQVQLRPDDKVLLGQLLAMLQDSGLAALEWQAIATQFSGRDRVVAGIINYAQEAGLVCQVASGWWLHGAVVVAAVAELEPHFGMEAAFSLAAARDLWRTSRKHAVMLLEYLDGRCITTRQADARVLAPDWSEKLNTVTDF